MIYNGDSTSSNIDNPSLINHLFVSNSYFIKIIILYLILSIYITIKIYNKLYNILFITTFKIYSSTIKYITE